MISPKAIELLEQAIEAGKNNQADQMVVFCARLQNQKLDAISMWAIADEIKYFNQRLRSVNEVVKFLESKYNELTHDVAGVRLSKY